MAPSSFGPEGFWVGVRQGEAPAALHAKLLENDVFRNETYVKSYERLCETVKAIEKDGLIPWVKGPSASVIQKDVVLSTIRKEKTHDPTANNTFFSDALLQSLTPIILTRHPALSVPSWHRIQNGFWHGAADDEPNRLLVSLAWQRMILDYCKHRQGQRGADTALPYAMPIVVDAEDIIYNTEPTMQKLCSLIGIDSAGVQYSWDPMPEEKLSEQLLDGWFFRDLFKSTGVQMRTNKPAEKALDLDAEMAKWTAEFGIEEAKVIRATVDEELPNYEYLRQHKLSA